MIVSENGKKKIKNNILLSNSKKEKLKINTNINYSIYSWLNLILKDIKLKDLLKYNGSLLISFKIEGMSKYNTDFYNIIKKIEDENILLNNLINTINSYVTAENENVYYDFFLSRLIFSGILLKKYDMQCIYYYDFIKFIITDIKENDKIIEELNIIFEISKEYININNKNSELSIKEIREIIKKYKNHRNSYRNNNNNIDKIMKLYDITSKKEIEEDNSKEDKRKEIFNKYGELKNLNMTPHLRNKNKKNVDKIIEFQEYQDGLKEDFNKILDFLEFIIKEEEQNQNKNISLYVFANNIDMFYNKYLKKDIYYKKGNKKNTNNLENSSSSGKDLLKGFED